ncbi:hypothetical protein [Kitasatospora sp. NPDC091276]|uniref:hypothetical protein n=1 Tax=Kitasatospora sp. NPDC091276 TaxID=3155300 RepID=UPI003432CC31
MHSDLDDALAEHSEAVTAWNERRAEARRIEDPRERAAALTALRREKPRHPYLGGISLTALGLGNRLIIRAVRPHAARLKVTKQQVGGALGLAVFFSPVLARPVARYAPTTITVVLVLWVVVAVVVGNTKAAVELAEADTKAREEAAEGKAARTAKSRSGASAEASAEAEPDYADDQEDEPQDPPADADLYALIRHVAAQSDQGTAAHLPDLLTEGQHRGWFGGWEQADLWAHLEALGAHLVKGKKLTFDGRQRNRQAVLLEGLPESDPGTVPAVLQKTG